MLERGLAADPVIISAPERVTQRTILRGFIGGSFSATGVASASLKTSDSRSLDSGAVTVASGSSAGHHWIYFIEHW